MTTAFTRILILLCGFSIGILASHAAQAGSTVLLKGYLAEGSTSGTQGSPEVAVPCGDIPVTQSYVSVGKIRLSVDPCAVTNQVAQAVVTPSLITSEIQFADGTSQSSSAIAVLADERPSGTNAPGSYATTWTSRALTSILPGSDSIVLAETSGEFTLQPGTYRIEALQSFSSEASMQVGFKGRIRNITDNTTAINGVSCRLHIAMGESASDYCPVSGLVTIAAPKTFALQYYSQTARSNMGYALASGEPERYVQITIFKLK